MRQYRTNCCQISFPVLLILILFLFQVLINSIIANSGGSEIPPRFRPQYQSLKLINYDESFETTCNITFPDGSDYQIDYGSGRILYANEDPSVTLGSPGPIRTCSLDADLTLLDTTRQGSGFIGNVSQRLCDYKSNRAYVNFERGATQYVCGRTYYNAPKWVSFPSQSQMESDIFNTWSYQNASGGFVFKKWDLARRKFDFKVVYNDTVTKGKDLTLLMNFITTALLRTLFPAPPSFKFAYPPPASFGPTADRALALKGIRDFPADRAAREFDIISVLGTFIYIFIFQLLLPVFLGSLVAEKQYRLREIMKMMGLKTSVYWTVTYVFNLSLYLITVFLAILVAVICDYRFFRVNDFGTYFILLFLFGNTMIAASFLLSVFLSNASTAFVVGYLYVFISGIISINVIQQYVAAETVSDATLFGVSIIPTFALYRGLYVIQANVSYYGPGLKMKDVNNPEVRLGEVYAFLIIEWIILLLAAIYLEQVVPDGIGVKKHPLFLFRGWFKKRREALPKDAPLAQSQLDGEPADVAEERRRTLSSTEVFCRTLDLQKVYPPRGGGPAKTAVHQLTMGVDYGECFGFLGPNGAGKTTTINMMCGYFMPTSGTAMINGLDIHTDIDKIHMLMGVCPQDDLLWPDLTAREHLRFYGKLKNMKGKLLEEAVNYRLEQVNLLDVGNKRAGAFSGGMKRRLSVAMALIGNPRVVLLDEPSTGLDPSSRRHLWDIINEYKKDCSMLLTTHSMEEADALCDRLGIFSAGKLRCVGTAAELKRRFGSGFVLTVSSSITTEINVHAFVMKLIPSAQFVNAIAGTRRYELPRDSFSMKDIFQQFEQKKESLGITDWCISNTTLEEVFLKIAEIVD